MLTKVVLITGATGYFGRYFVKELSNYYSIVALGRDIEKLDELSEFTLENVCLDMYDINKTVQVIEQLSNKYDIYGLINNAYDFSTKTGFNTPCGKFEMISIDMMRNGLESGILSPMVITQIVCKQMIEKGIHGSIINISSMYGLVTPDVNLYEGKSVFNPIVYSVSKAAIDAMTRYIASFFGQYGIRCNSIAPGPFPNIESQSDNSPDDKEFLERLKKKTMLNRFGHPKELLGVLKLLLSDDSSFITGEIISVDGGWTKK
ncbi:MAG: SDR family oxidoreductase [Arcobacteraceae bacterium]|jgi:gluconate 5-dehydrogenase|nr:SDR family oxidoreductase [Arcobacteraceae bacterium]